jgi:Transglycosylase SLT domain
MALEVETEPLPGTPPPPPTGLPAGAAPVSSPPTPQAGLKPATYRDIITAEAKKQKIPPALALAMVDQESAGDPVATSPKGAHGFFQLMPETAAELGIDPADPIQNIQGGLKYFRQQLDAHKGDVSLALASYNAGPGAVRKAGGIPNFPETQDYVKRIMGKLQASAPGQAPPSPQQAKPVPPAGAPTAPTVGAPPPAAPESWTDWGIRHGKEMLHGFDPRNPEGRRNIAGAVGAAGGTILGLPTLAVAGPAGPATTGLMGAMAAGGLEAGGEALVRHLTGAGELGGDVAKPPPTLKQVAGATAAGATEQGIYEMGGHAMMWPIKAVGRRLVAGRVGRFAAEKLTAGKAATLDALTTALDSSQTLLRTTKATAKEATAQATAGTRDLVSDAAGTARKGVQAAVEKGTSQKEGAAMLASQGVADAETAAASGEATARAPYDALVGAPPPSASAAGKQANAVIQEGGAAKARDIAGKAVDAAADSGPDIDITALKAEAQKVIETQLQPPATSFPRTSPAQIGAEEISAQSGLAPSEIVKMQEKAAGGDTRAAANLQTLQEAVASAQGEAGKETLKHPAIGVLSRILNAGDTVPFKDAHLWKVELDNAIRGTRDQSVRSQVASLTQKFTGSLRTAMKEAGHAPYEAATAAYAKIAPLYTKGMAPRLRKLVMEEPEAVVRLLNPSQPSKAKMFVDLLTHQAEAGGDAGEGRQALEAVQAAWVHQKLLQGGIEKLGDRLSKLPPAFRDAFLGDPKAKAVLDNLHLIDTAFKTAQLTGERGIGAAKTAGKEGVEAVGDLAAQRTSAAREAGYQGVNAARTARGDAIADVRQTGTAAVESAAQHVEPAKRALQEGRQAAKTAQGAFNKSSVSAYTAKGSTRQAATDVLRAATLGPGKLYGAVSLARLLTGPTAQDLLVWAAASPSGTRALVKAITSPAWDLAVADLVRSSGILEGVTNKATGQSTPATKPQGSGVGTPPPPDPTGKRFGPYALGTPPPAR